ncbi:MAG: aminopeptidase P family protein [Phenylobacterium sp.]|uniref:M24 family metallopeptidase n=1 Tax=Phenylobacterium sp. TaxID=1871053 RepID=UPI001A630483|nr:M24 family metallopeptidase [Phenylobacterium sp.]MBL8771154.1 aminopeptidase P family protein [Phenylobacterium sp.]
MKGWMIAGAAALLAGSASAAEPPVLPLSQTEAVRPALPEILTQRDRARVVNAILAERLETIVPQLMREQGFDMWILVAREYLEDPVVATMLNAESLRARRRTILVFFDPGDGRPVERLTVSRYGLGGLFQPAWNPDQQPDQWKALADLVARRAPKRIAVNVSGRTAFGDGLTHSQYSEMMAAFAPELRAKVAANDSLAVGWLETRSPTELKIYPGIVRLAHAILAEGLSARTIRPGVTTTADVQWFLRERMARLGVDTWFHPSVGVQRQGVKELLEGDTVIRKGDLVWTDFGVTYLRLNTDTQHLAYVLKDGERDAPEGLKAGLRAANAIQDALTSSFRTGVTGNDILAEARRKAIAAGLKPSIYSHPLGYHGHGAGPAIGFWDNQNADPRGDFPVRAPTVWSIELSAFATVPEWGGQEVQFRTEEDAFFDGTTVRYLDGRQTELTLIGAR